MGAFFLSRLWLPLLCLVAVSAPADATDKGLGVTASTEDDLGDALNIEDPDIRDYLKVCMALRITPSADVLIRLQLGISELKIRSTKTRPFGDLELQALVQLLEADHGKKLSQIRSLDFSSAAIGPSGMLLLANMLQRPECRVEALDIAYQRIDAQGVKALADAARSTRTLHTLNLKNCWLGDDGAEELVKLFAQPNSTGLKHINVENNFISYAVCDKLRERAKMSGADVNLAGNRVLDEVFNAVSHGIGAILAIVGSIFLMKKVSDKPWYVIRAMSMYCASLIVLYLASTLFHSFFAIGPTTVYIFNVLDFSGIFLLIAGSYAPFLGVLLVREPWALPMMSLMWITAAVGICTAAFYFGPGAVIIRLSLYITMGWACLICMKPMSQHLGRDGTILLVAGGVLYTAGVPWFVINRHVGIIPMHTIWHIFVVAASTAHYFCIYWHVASDNVIGIKSLPKGPSSPAKLGASTQDPYVTIEDAEDGLSNGGL